MQRRRGTGHFLSSRYELIRDQLIFEVSSDKKLEEEIKVVTNYSINSLQRVIFKKIKTTPTQKQDDSINYC